MEKLSYLEIIRIIKEKKFKKIFTFGQNRGGTTITSFVLAHELNYLDYFVPEEISNNLHPKRMFIELIKNHKIFIHNHHNVFKRKLLNNKDTIFIFIYRDHRDVSKSFMKTKKRNINFDWEADIINRVLKNKIKTDNPVKYLNDLWLLQKKNFNNAYTLDFKSLEKHKFFVNEETRDKVFSDVKQIFLEGKANIKDNFNLKKYYNEKGLNYLKMLFTYYFYKLKIFLRA